MLTAKKQAKSHRGLLIFFLFVLFVVIARVILPSLIKSVANNRLEKESPYFTFHINDVDLSFHRGLYSVEGVSGKIRSTGENFLNIDRVTVDVPWKGIFKGNTTADVTVDKMNLQASQTLLDTAKLESERMKQLQAQQPKKEEASPVKINSLAVRDSNVTIHDFMSFKGDEKRSITDIYALVTNLTPEGEDALTKYQISANVFGPAPFKAVGTARIKEEPPQFDINSEMKNFDISTVNPIIREKVNAFVHKGKLDLYAEAKSEEGKIEGYVKPFVSKLKMDTPKEGFNFKGEVAKDAGNLMKILLTDSEAKTLATKIPFTYERDKEKMDIEIIPVLTKAIEHKAMQNIPTGLEDSIGQQGLGISNGTMQAEEAKEDK